MSKWTVAVLLMAVVQASPAHACSVNPARYPPSVQSAFDAAQVVVHARVLSQTGGEDSTVTVEPLRILKGTFSGNAVKTASHSLCGANLEDGVEYVFFFRKGDGYFVSYPSQPVGSAAEVLSLLPKNARGALVPEPVRPSGRYLQMGLRRPLRPTTNDPDPFVNIQIDLGTRELCESRLAGVPKGYGPGAVLGGEEAWCSPESASAKLRYHGMVKNGSAGKVFHIETDSLEGCQSLADQAVRAGGASGKAIKLGLACQAR